MKGLPRRRLRIPVILPLIFLPTLLLLLLLLLVVVIKLNISLVKFALHIFADTVIAVANELRDIALDSGRSTKQSVKLDIPIQRIVSTASILLNHHVKSIDNTFGIRIVASFRAIEKTRKGNTSACSSCTAANIVNPLPKQIYNMIHIITVFSNTTSFCIIKTSLLRLCLKNISLRLLIIYFCLSVINDSIIIHLLVLSLFLASHRFCNLTECTGKINILTTHRKRFRMNRLRAKHQQWIISGIFITFTLKGRKFRSLPLCHIFGSLNLLIKTVIAGRKIQAR